MAGTATVASRQALAKILPAPMTSHWSVRLKFVDGVSNKEYRILSIGTRTVFQYGRAGQPGQLVKNGAVDHGSVEAATAAALKQWVSKEGKTENPYWPTSGIMPLDPAALDQINFHRSGSYAATSVVDGAYRAAVAAAANIRAGNQLFVCQMPSQGAVSTTLEALTKLAHGTGLLGSQHEFKPGSYGMLAVGPQSVPLLTAACPIAVPVGSMRDDNTVAVGEIAQDMWTKSNDPDLNIRRQLAEALDFAQLIMGV